MPSITLSASRSADPWLGFAGSASRARLRGFGLRAGALF
jgi:hypothetical protein